MSELIKSYVWHGDKCFFVSTINRKCSAPEGDMFSETIVWEVNWSTKERGASVCEDSGVCDSIATHIRICEALFKTGKTNAA